MFQQLERVGGKAAKNQTGEELQQMRYATCKIYQILCTQGKLDDLKKSKQSLFSERKSQEKVTENMENRV